jgi:hypothetical protein
MSSPNALFDRDGATLLPTTLCRGPWDHGYLHGSPVCGALGWTLEQAHTDETLVLARATIEIRSMVPLEPLRTQWTIVKPGRRAQVIEATLTNGRGVVARVASQWVTYRPSGAPPVAQAVPRRPEGATPTDPGAIFDYPRPGFNCDAVEVCPLTGGTEEPGPGSVWVRLRVPVVEGEQTSPLLSLLTLTDFAAAVGWEHSPTGAAFINTDVTLQINRYPVGPWLLMDSRTHASQIGVAFLETTISDDAGPFGRVLQTLVETAGPPMAAP